MAEALTLDSCSCLPFLSIEGDGRIEYYESCARHWRIALEQSAIARHSHPVDDLDGFLDAIAG